VVLASTDVLDDVVDRVAACTLEEVMTRRSTWTLTER